VWKGGRTGAGARAAASHTGALASSDIIWRVALSQAGAIGVESMEELADTLLAFQDLPPLEECSLAIVGGLFDGAGGYCVAAADSCAALGLNIPPFAAETRERLEAIFPSVGTILRNPVDTGGAVFSEVEPFRDLFQALVADPDTNLVLLVEPVDFFLRYISQEKFCALNDIVADLSRSKPFVVVSPPGLTEAERIVVEKRFADARIPVYPTVERAARAIVNVLRYWKFRGEVGESTP
jgi:acyl-CoA synthetase (NDP forming)